MLLGLALMIDHGLGLVAHHASGTEQAIDQVGVLRRLSRRSGAESLIEAPHPVQPAREAAKLPPVPTAQGTAPARYSVAWSAARGETAYVPAVGSPSGNTRPATAAAAPARRGWSALRRASRDRERGTVIGERDHRRVAAASAALRDAEGHARPAR